MNDMHIVLKAAFWVRLYKTLKYFFTTCFVVKKTDWLTFTLTIVNFKDWTNSRAFVEILNKYNEFRVVIRVWVRLEWRNRYELTPVR